MSIAYYSDYELVADTIEYEYRNKVNIIYTQLNIAVWKVPQRRQVRTKVYEATIQEDCSESELPAPSYLAGNSYVEVNPESLSPIGTKAEQWHCDNISYTKELSVPLSRVIRITWVKEGAWTKYDDSESI